MHRCSRCQRDYPRSDFQRDYRTPNGIKGWCSPCRVEYNREWRRKRFPVVHQKRTTRRWTDEELVRNRIKMRRRYVRGAIGNSVSVPYAQCIVCRSLYVRQRVAANRLHCPKPSKFAECHPDRKHHAKGQCRPCYSATRNPAKPTSVEACPECGDSFRQKVYGQRYCSRSCGRLNRKRRDKARRRALMRASFVEDVEPLLVFERDGWICQLCFQPVPRLVPVPDPWAATVDHIVPLGGVHGGTHEYANVQLAHFICNSRKSDRLGLPVAA